MREKKKEEKGRKRIKEGSKRKGNRELRPPQQAKVKDKIKYNNNNNNNKIKRKEMESLNHCAVKGGKKSYFYRPISSIKDVLT